MEMERNKMNETITVNMENLTDTEREQLMNLVKKASNEEKKSKVWKPKIGESYYDLGATCLTWRDDSSDNYLYSIGEVFKTAEEADEEEKRRKILNQWKRLSVEAGEEENEWNANKFDPSSLCTL